MADWAPPEAQKAWQPPEAKAKADAPSSEPSFFRDPGGAIKQFWSEFTARPAGTKESDVVAPGGKTFAEKLQQAESIGFSAGPANLAMARAASAPSLAAANRLADFKRVGVTPNVPAVGQGRVSGLAANVGRTLPFSPIESGIRQNLGEVQTSSESFANQLGMPTTPADAGAIAKNAISRFAKDDTQAEKDFGEFFRQMSGAPPVKMTSTVSTLQKFMGKFPSAKGLEGLFTSSPIAKLKSELEPRQVQIPAKTSPVLSASGQPIVTTPATTVTKGGALTVPELKTLRTQIGYLLNHINFGPEQIPKAELRQLYGSLTKDLETAAAKQSKSALRALKVANFNYGTRMKLIDELEPLVREGQASPESVFKRLNSAAEGGNAGLLVTAKKVLDPQEWGQVGASIVQKLGRPPPGAANLLQGTPFSVSSYVTNWAKLSDKAKGLLFGSGYIRDNLEALARVTSSLKNVEKLANVSHSGEFVNVARTVETVFAALAAGSFPWATTAGIGGAYGTAKLMMSPKFTSWLYSVPGITARANTLQGASRAASESLRRVLLSEAPYVGPPPQRPYSDTMRRAAQPVSPPTQPDRRSENARSSAIQSAVDVRHSELAHAMAGDPALMSHYNQGRTIAGQWFDGFITFDEALKMAPTGRLPYAAFRKGLEERRDELLRELTPRSDAASRAMSAAA